MTGLHRRGFVRAEGTQLVDDDGPLLPRGVGLGNWLLQEGYMWHFGHELAAAHQIEARVRHLLGDGRAEEFWNAFRSRFISEQDFALIADLGFDHVRLPINARGVVDETGGTLEDGLRMIDDAVAWSERHGLRILLDLHGAPGGQTGTNIDDSRHGRPELFESETYRDRTVALWTALARRYRDREAVLGYDLLNEPLPNHWQHVYPDQLVEVYRDLTAAIRAVDPNHLLMYEGSHWATNPAPLETRYDDNQVLQFHRYWCAPDETSIQEFLDLRERTGSPIYMGEGGENTPGWIYAATRLYERHGIGWNFWPWKKLETLTSPLSVIRPDGWEEIADPRREPAPGLAASVLERYLESLDASNCVLRGEVVDALFARPSLRLPAWAGLVDGVAATRAGVTDTLPEGIWHHTAGEQYGPEERVSVHLAEGSTLGFELAAEPSVVEIDGDSDLLDVRWDGRVLSLTSRGAARVRAVGLET